MATPGRYSPDDTVSRDQLAPATVVQRRTEPVTSSRRRGKFDTRVPCCDRWARIQYNGSDAFSLLVCTPCGLVYEVDLVDEHSGRWDDQPSYLAHLTVLDAATVTFAVRRPSRNRSRSTPTDTHRTVS